MAGFCHLFATNYSMLLVIYLVWGFTAPLRLLARPGQGIRSLASSEEQGRPGFMEAGRGVTNAAHLALFWRSSPLRAKKQRQRRLATQGEASSSTHVVVILLGIPSAPLLQGS